MGFFLDPDPDPMTTTPFDPAREIAADLDTPVSAFLKLRELDPVFLLESVAGGERVGRYSFIGVGRRHEVTLERDTLTVDGSSNGVDGDPLADVTCLQHKEKIRLVFKSRLSLT